MLKSNQYLHALADCWAAPFFAALLLFFRSITLDGSSLYEIMKKRAAKVLVTP
jgi:hypothetical protein